LNGWDIHLDTVNPKLLELQAAKEILADMYNIQISEVDNLIQQRIVDFKLAGLEFRYMHQGLIYHEEDILASCNAGYSHITA